MGPELILLKLFYLFIFLNSLAIVIDYRIVLLNGKAEQVLDNY